jgi:hypothetical protein
MISDSEQQSLCHRKKSMQINIWIGNGDRSPDARWDSLPKNGDPWCVVIGFRESGEISGQSQPTVGLTAALPDEVRRGQEQGIIKKKSRSKNYFSHRACRKFRATYSSVAINRET